MQSVMWGGYSQVPWHQQKRRSGVASAADDVETPAGSPDRERMGKW